jgi:hypothetical protein
MHHALGAQHIAAQIERVQRREESQTAQLSQERHTMRPHVIVVEREPPQQRQTLQARLQHFARGCAQLVAPKIQGRQRRSCSC